jgi:hypothetical protein
MDVYSLGVMRFGGTRGSQTDDASEAGVGPGVLASMRRMSDGRSDSGFLVRYHRCC